MYASRADGYGDGLDIGARVQLDGHSDLGRIRDQIHGIAVEVEQQLAGGAGRAVKNEPQ